MLRLSALVFGFKMLRLNRPKGTALGTGGAYPYFFRRPHLLDAYAISSVNHRE